MLHYSFAELMNYYIDEAYSATIYFKHLTKTILYSIYRPVIVINSAMLTIK
jgi:hypothetical protein